MQYYNTTSDKNHHPTKEYNAMNTAEAIALTVLGVTFMVCLVVMVLKAPARKSSLSTLDVLAQQSPTMWTYTSTPVDDDTSGRNRESTSATTSDFTTWKHNS